MATTEASLALTAKQVQEIDALFHTADLHTLLAYRDANAMLCAKNVLADSRLAQENAIEYAKLTVHASKRVEELITQLEARAELHRPVSVTTNLAERDV